MQSSSYASLHWRQLESVLLLTVSQVVLAKGLRFWFSRTEVQQHATQKQVQELQSYVTEHHLASTDVKELTDWSHKRRYTLLELYRGQTMIYSSFAPKDGMISFLPQNGTSDQNPGVLVDKTGVYDWLLCYTLTFADGEVRRDALLQRLQYLLRHRVRNLALPVHLMVVPEPLPAALPQDRALRRAAQRGDPGHGGRRSGSPHYHPRQR